MEEAEGFFLSLTEAVPVGAGGFEEVEGADDVRLDELGGAVDGPVDMGLGGEVHDGAGLMLGEQARNQFGIPDIAADKGVAWISLEGGKVLEIAGVGELVEIDDGVLLQGDPVEDEVGTDEAGSAGDEDCLHMRDET